MLLSRLHYKRPPPSVLVRTAVSLRIPLSLIEQDGYVDLPAWSQQDPKRVIQSHVLNVETCCTQRYDATRESRTVPFCFGFTSNGLLSIFFRESQLESSMRISESAKLSSKSKSCTWIESRANMIIYIRNNNPRDCSFENLRRTECTERAKLRSYLTIIVRYRPFKRSSGEFSQILTVICRAPLAGRFGSL